MAKIQIKDLEDEALDAAVALLLGAKWDDTQGIFVWSSLGVKDAYSLAAPSYSTDWALGGPILDRENIATERGGDGWQAAHMMFDEKSIRLSGPTKLSAGIKFFVAMKLKNDWIEIPEKFIEERKGSHLDQCPRG